MAGGVQCFLTCSVCGETERSFDVRYREPEEVDENFVCLATADPIINDHINDCRGYLVEMITGPFDEVAPKGMN